MAEGLLVVLLAFYFVLHAWLQKNFQCVRPAVKSQRRKEFVMYFRQRAHCLLALCFLVFALIGCAQDGGPEVRVRGSWEVGGGAVAH